MKGWDYVWQVVSTWRQPAIERGLVDLTRDRVIRKKTPAKAVQFAFFHCALWLESAYDWSRQCCVDTAIAEIEYK